MSSTGTGESGDVKKVFLWIHPRSLSTALEKCMASIPGVQAYHEPYFSCYLNRVFSEKMHLFPDITPIEDKFTESRKELDEAGDSHRFAGCKLRRATQFNYKWLQDQLNGNQNEGTNLVFIKDSTLAIDGHYEYLPKNLQHTFLIRDPRRTAVSTRKMMSRLMNDDSPDFNVYFKHPIKGWEEVDNDSLFVFYNYVKENIEPDPVVIDADDLSNYPEKILPKYFARIGLKYDEKYLSWNPSIDIVRNIVGSVDQMVVGMKYSVYDSAFKSSRFFKASSPPPAWRDLHWSELMYASDHADGYKVMYDNRIRP